MSGAAGSVLGMEQTPAKIALVTGAGSGIGRACAIALAQAGFTVVLSGRRPAAIEEASAEAGSRSVAIPADVADPRSVEALFAQIKGKFGRLDLLFNNAGVNVPAIPLEEITPEQWRSVIDTNLTGSFLCIRQAFLLMKAQSPQGGRIINNGSVSALTPRPNSAPYTASKHGVAGLTKSVSLDGRKYNIACSEVDIGNVNAGLATRMSKGVLQADLSVKPEPTFDMKHLASLVVYMASLPLDANVQNVTLMATKMPLVGRG